MADNSIVLTKINALIAHAKTSIIFCPRLLPLSRPKVNRNALVHAVHDIINGPRLILVSRREVGWYVRFVKLDALVHVVDILLVVLISIWFGVVAPDPFGELGLCTSRIEFDLVPVRLLEKLCVGEAELLSAGVSDEAVRCCVSSVFRMLWCCNTYRNLM